jgi:hypothetical protein
LRTFTRQAMHPDWEDRQGRVWRAQRSPTGFDKFMTNTSASEEFYSTEHWQGRAKGDRKGSNMVIRWSGNGKDYRARIHRGLDYRCAGDSCHRTDLCLARLNVSRVRQNGALCALFTRLLVGFPSAWVNWIAIVSVIQFETEVST